MINKRTSKVWMTILSTTKTKIAIISFKGSLYLDRIPIISNSSIHKNLILLPIIKAMNLTKDSLDLSIIRMQLLQLPITISYHQPVIFSCSTQTKLQRATSSRASKKIRSIFSSSKTSKHKTVTMWITT